MIQFYELTMARKILILRLTKPTLQNLRMIINTSSKIARAVMATTNPAVPLTSDAVTSLASTLPLPFAIDWAARPSSPLFAPNAIAAAIRAGKLPNCILIKYAYKLMYACVLI